MSKKGKKEKQNNEIYSIYNSPYSNSLDRLLKLCSQCSKSLETKIKHLKEKQTNYPLIPIIVFLISFIILIILMIATNGNHILSSSIPLGLFIPSIPITIISAIKNKHNLNIANNQLYTIETIEEYLKSELEISKKYDNLLSNTQILNNEKRVNQKITDILNCETSFSQLANTYQEEYHKNLIIIDSLRNLDSKQKELYLKNIYNQIDNIIFTKNNINIKDNEELASIDNNSQKMLTTSNSLNETLQNQDETLNSVQKGISLNKDNYAINNSNELNNIFTIYQQDEDILPPKAQEEMEKGHQFSKKFPK